MEGRGRERGYTYLRGGGRKGEGEGLHLLEMRWKEGGGRGATLT